VEVRRSCQSQRRALGLGKRVSLTGEAGVSVALRVALGCALLFALQGYTTS
jgi:hypothetical protein